jgi:hypothetical protein
VVQGKLGKLHYLASTSQEAVTAQPDASTALRQAVLFLGETKVTGMFFSLLPEVSERQSERAKDALSSLPEALNFLEET